MTQFDHQWYSVFGTERPLPVTAKPPTSRQRGRKVAAILAGGLVFGVGTMATLAAWNDDEFATGNFTTGTFNLVGSTDGTSFTDHATSPGAALGFTVNPLNLTPNDTVYAGFAVRLAEDTTSPATITLSGAPGGDVTGLTYTLLDTGNTFGCTSTTSGTALVAASTPLGNVPGTVTFDLSQGSPVTSAGTAVNLCFKVTAGSALAQNQTGSATWQFHAESQ